MTRPGQTKAARIYFLIQGTGTLLWWVAVFFVPGIAVATLGHLDPERWVIADGLIFGIGSLLAARFPKGIAEGVTLWGWLVTALLAFQGLVYAVGGLGLVGMTYASGASTLALLTLRLGHLPNEWLIVGPFRFRTTSDTEPSHHLTRTAAQLITFWAAFLLVLPLIIVGIEWRLNLEWSAMKHPAVMVVGLVIFALASGLGLWSALAMAELGKGTPLPCTMAQQLVVAGPYAYVRNPMAIAGIVQGAAVGFALGSWLVVLYALTGSLVWNAGVRPLEEADMEERFGDDYRTYQKAVRCWLPRTSRFG